MTVFCLGLQNLSAQDNSKNKVRLKVDYVKIINGDSYLDISTGARIDKKNVSVPYLDLLIYNETEQDEIELGTITTNPKGKIKFVLPELRSMLPDSSQIYTIKVAFKGNENFKRASKSVSFKDANIAARLITKDSLNYISATLTDAYSNSPISDEHLNIQVQRLFNPLKMGEEFNNTDDKGMVLVPIEEGIPGIDGNLLIEVVLNDNDTYGTIKAIVEAPIGKVIIDESTFDKRTLWSPRDKTPLFILVFGNFLIFGMWGIIIYLIVNLFRIKKV
jgi:hypothetical protein